MNNSKTQNFDQSDLTTLTASTVESESCDKNDNKSDNENKNENENEYENESET
jgi:hypothetical protein